MNPHSKFFSSLSRLEKRLKLETHSPPKDHKETISNPQYQENNTDDTPTTQSLGSPIYLYHSNPTPTSNPTSNLQESQPPQAFSNPIPTSPIQENPIAQKPEKDQEIEMLMKHLGLDDEVEQKGGKCGAFEGKDEIFLGKIVGVKGVKSERELERLNGWIEYLLNKDGDGGIKQPLRLAHLLLAKASFVYDNNDDDGDEFERPQFPSTVEEFLQYDPPAT